jgi:hypothetical protein
LKGENVDLANAIGAATTTLQTVKIQATAKWVALPMKVYNGDLIYFKSATGKWRTKQACAMVGSEGYTQGACELTPAESKRNVRGVLIPTGRPGALLWRVDSMKESAYVMLLGKEPTEIPHSGQLEFQINDDALSDNEGAVELELAITQ